MGYAQGGQEPDGASCGGRLTEMAVKYGFEGNLWHCFLAFCLANNENAYTTTCEITGAAGGSLDELAREDCRIFKALFDYDIRNLEPSGLWTLMAVSYTHLDVYKRQRLPCPALWPRDW